jgi:hypothetical protein
MKSKIVIIITIILFITTAIIYDNFYTNKMVSGSYVYNFPTYIVDGPKTGDILNLKENGTFESNSWGNGTFIINGSDLELSYKDEFGKSSFDCGIYRPFFFGEPHISICRDLDYYFKKNK